ncbi:MAG TPA: YbaK/EbsC family protein [Acidimicrobiia bacterium]|nr:YbaK/EbsC family protein [Acidimicrobiia bacterium]
MDPMERRVLDHLDRLGAAYETVRIDPELADTAAFCEHYGYALDESANAILVASKKPEGRVALCLALATTRLDVNHAVRDLLDVRKLSFASPEVTIEATGMEIGGVTPFGVPEEVPVYVDARIVALGRCIVGGGSRSMKLLVDPEVFGRMPGVTVVEGLAS